MTFCLYKQILYESRVFVFDKLDVFRLIVMDYGLIPVLNEEKKWYQEK